MEPDPEQQRIEELLGRDRAGQSTAAEREELQLYLKEHPGLLQRVQRGQREAALGEGWLQRVEADRQIQAMEASPRTRFERGLGVGLLLAGFGLGFVAPIVGPLTMGAGTLLLVYSFVRSRLNEHKIDPYKDVAQ